MRAWTRSVGAVWLGGALASGACAPPTQGDPKAEGPAERTTFEWAELAIGGPEPRWGSFAIERAEDTLVLGGVSGAGDAVLDETLVVSPGDEQLGVAADVAIDRARYCHCAMLDESRQQLVVLGGRGGNFGEAASAFSVDLASGAASALDHAGAADFPVGCQTMFFPSLDRGYVFGGLSGERSAFSSLTYRYDAATQTFTELGIAGPPARYDAATHVLDDGSALLVGGMGRTPLGVVFYADVWRFDPVTESWTEVPTASDAPPGRRYPWSAVSPDEETLLFGFGSDSPMGTSVLGDLWAFSLADGTWSELALPDGPSARGFTYRWKGTDASAGVLAYGFDGATAVGDAWTLLVPDALRGRWH